MKKIDVKIKKLSDGAKIPVYATADSSACDLCAAIGSSHESGSVVINPGEIKLIPTGISIECELDGAFDVSILIFARSGLASKRGISMANGVGVVDSDYRGEIKVPLINLSAEPYEIHSGDRIAQMMFVPIAKASFVESDELGETERGDGGFGSTGLSNGNIDIH